MRRYFIYLLVFLTCLNFCLKATASTVQVTAAPKELGFDPFYKKYLDCNGIHVISSEQVSDKAFYRLKELLDKMLENRPDLRKTLVKEKFKYIIIGQHEQVTDIPDYAHMKPKDFWNLRARGFGGRTTSCGEENLLSLPGDRYDDESIFIHELAHGIHSPGLKTCDPNFQTRLDALYKKAMDKGLYKNDYASTNSTEYWAEAVQAFFNCDRENNWNHNHVNTRKELMEYDPDVANFVKEIFRITEENDWRYKPLKNLPYVESTPKKLNPHGMFPKYIRCFELSILGTKNVPDEAMLCAASTIRNMFRYRYDILRTLVEANVTLVIYEDKDMPLPKDISMGISTGFFIKEDKGRALIQIPNKFRFGIPASDILNNDDESTSSKLIHDFALTAYIYTGFREVIPNFANRKNIQQFEKGLKRMDLRFDKRMNTLYNSAIVKDLWKTTPASKNRFEYFAQGVKSFFNANNIIVANEQSVNNREQLIHYDQDLALLIADIFKHPYRNDWRYRSCASASRHANPD